MTINATNSSTIPFHIARAYGVPSNAQAVRGSGTGPVQAPAPVQKVQAATAERGGLSRAGQALVAAVVPGKVDFSGDSPKPSVASESLSLYRHPADKNAAATGVLLGRRLDVNG